MSRRFVDSFNISDDLDDSKNGKGETFYHTVRSVQQLLRLAIIDLQAPGPSGFVKTIVQQIPIVPQGAKALQSQVAKGFRSNERVLAVGGFRSRRADGQVDGT